MKDFKDNFDSQIKSVLDRYELPYEDGMWEDLENRLEQAEATASKSGKWGASKLLMVVGASIAILSASYWMLNDSTSDTKELTVVKNQEDVQEQLITEGVTQQTPIKVEEPKNVQPQSNKTILPVEKQEETIQKSNSITKSKKTKTELSTLEGDQKANKQIETSVKEDIVTYKEIPTPKAESMHKAPVQLDAPKANKMFACIGETIEFNSGDQSPENYGWLIDGQSFDGNAILRTSFDKEGYYDVQLVSSNQQYANSNSIQVQVIAAPVASFNIPQEEMIDGLRLHVFEAENENLEHKWNFGNGYQTKSNTAQVFYKKRGSYSIEHTVEDKRTKCKSTHVETIIIEKDYNLFAPNSFSPNGDGKNDQWFPQALNNSTRNFILEIRDINQNIIFRTGDKNVKWNGEVNGQIARPGDRFFWRAIVEHNGQEEFNGVITIFEN